MGDSDTNDDRLADIGARMGAKIAPLEIELATAVQDSCRQASKRAV